MAKISIIVPCFNYGCFLSETLDSVLNQSLQDWECIIVDDGSTDNTSIIAKSYFEKDKRINYYYQPNHGPSSARNMGIKKAQGKYIQFLDADDLLEKNKLLIQSEYLDNEISVDIVYSGMMKFVHGKYGNFFYSSPNPLIDKKWMPDISGHGHFIIDTLIKQNIMVVSSPLIRKSVFEKVGLFNPNLKCYEDMDFWIKCALNNINFHHLEADFTNSIIRVHENSQMTHSLSMMEGEIKMRKGFHRHLLNKDQKKLNRKILIERKGELALLFFQRKQILSGARQIVGIHSPMFFRFLYRAARIISKNAYNQVFA